MCVCILLLRRQEVVGKRRWDQIVPSLDHKGVTSGRPGGLSLGVQREGGGGSKRQIVWQVCGHYSSAVPNLGSVSFFVFPLNPALKYKFYYFYCLNIE